MIDPKVFKQVRKALGLSQQELADALGLSRVTVNKMERGRLRRGIPDNVAEMLMAIRAHPKALAPFRADPPSVKDTCFDCGEMIAPDGTCACDDEEDEAIRAKDKAVADDDHLWDNEEDES